MSRSRKGSAFPPFDEITFHARFEDHQAEAGRRVVTRLEAEDAWYGRRRIVPNRKSRRGPYLMIGTTSAARGITVVLLPTRDLGVWQGYTAWDTKVSDG